MFEIQHRDGSKQCLSVVKSNGYDKTLSSCFYDKNGKLIAGMSYTIETNYDEMGKAFAVANNSGSKVFQITYNGGKIPYNQMAI